MDFNSGMECCYDSSFSADLLRNPTKATHNQSIKLKMMINICTIIHWWVLCHSKCCGGFDVYDCV